MGINAIQPSFAAGELAPEMWGRVDVAKYRVGAKTMLNWYARRTGGACNRPGTQYVASAMPVAGAKLIPFQFSVTQAYMLEFGEIYAGIPTMRVFKDGGLVVVNLVDTSVYRWVKSGHGTNEYYVELLAGGDPQLVAQWGSYIVPVINGTAGVYNATLGTLTAGQFGYGDNDTLGFSTIYVRLSDGTDPDTKATGYVYIPVTIPSPYAAADVSKLKYCQTADTIYLTHPSYPPYKLTRTSHYNWSFSVVTFSNSVLSPTGLAGVWNGGSTTPKTVKYQVSTIGEDGQESLPCSSVSVSVNSPWDSGKWVALSWAGVNGATSYRVYKNSRGYFGYIGSAVKDYSKIANETPISGGDNVSYPKANAFDGLTSSYWGSTQTGAGLIGAAYIGQQYAAKKTVTKARFFTGSSGRVPTVSLDYSDDGSSWTTLQTFTVPTSAATWVEIVATNASSEHKYWRLCAQAAPTYWSTNPWYLSEVEFYADSISTAFVDDNIDEDIGDGPQTSNNPFSSSNNYPGSVGIFQQRLCMARTNNQPQTIWCSRTGQLENMGTSSPLKDDDEIEITLDARQMNEIKHVIPMRSLVALTTGAEFAVAPGSKSTSISPTNIQAVVQGSRGCSDIRPLVIGESVLFVQRSGDEVRDLTYSFQIDAMAGNNLSMLAAHLFRGYSITDWAYQQAPDSIVWVVRSDGVLLAFTFEKAQDVWAWSKHTTSGGLFEAVATIPNATSGWDDVYFIVNRSGTRYIEMLSQRSWSTLADAKFVDACGTYSGSATNTVSGLTWLASQSVSALADGVPYTGLTVSAGGVLTLPVGVTASKIQVGIPITADLEQLPAEFQGQEGSVTAQRKRVGQVRLRLADAAGITVGPGTCDTSTSTNNLTSITDFTAGSLFTGDVRLAVTGEWGTGGQVHIRQTQPLPCTVLDIVPVLEVGR